MPEARPLKFSCFVTGTDTEIGKTLIASTLVHALARAGLRATGMKPVAAGAQWQDGAWHNEDVDSLVSASNAGLPLSLVSPYLFQDAIAPHIAAQREGVAMRIEHIQECYAAMAAQAEAIVVEGVGGFCVPLTPTLDTSDLASRLALPVILVVGLRLGCISHAMLTARAIEARGLTLAGWVVNTVDADMPFQAENIDTLRQRLNAPLLGVVPRLAQPGVQEAAGFLDFSLMEGWPRG